MSSSFAQLAQINTAIYDTLKVADGLKYHQNYDKLSEAITNTPLLQVHWSNKTTDVSGTTDRTTFRAGLRQTDMTFYADLYADVLGHINQIFPKIFPLVDAIDTILEDQDGKPYFGLVIDNINVIKAFSWSVEKTTFIYEQQTGTELKYPGVRFTINVRVF